MTLTIRSNPIRRRRRLAWIRDAKTFGFRQ
jgi:hypothetical protein